MSKNDTLAADLVNKSSSATSSAGNRKRLPSAAQVRAARAILDWTQDDLAGAAGITPQTVRLLETGQRVPFDRTLRAMKSAFEAAGVTFVVEARGEGVILLQAVSEQE
ncbi:helix-turn-helix domain-containing protein [Pelagibacterium nitratireducens]|uniref:Helix-turn-helix domain-containing protein n=1 Tax=Pelagibacterium nitratireducens TaxID=1046114 RepID=A0ABZ2I811_9HYPH